MTRILTLAELDEAIAITTADLANESDPDEAVITRRDLDQLRRQRNEILGVWVPNLKAGSRAMQILEHLKEFGEATAPSIATICVMPLSTANRTITAMHSAGQVRRVKRGRYAIAK